MKNFFFLLFFLLDSLAYMKSQMGLYSQIFLSIEMVDKGITKPTFRNIAILTVEFLSILEDLENFLMVISRDFTNYLKSRMVVLKSNIDVFTNINI